jgi:PAS domain S-box-containing protein
MSERTVDTAMLPDAAMLHHLVTAGPLLLASYRVERAPGGEGRLVGEYLSANAEPYLGCTVAEALRDPGRAQQRVPPEERALFDTVAHPDRHRPIHVLIECRMLHDDGTYHWLRTRFDEDPVDPDRIYGCAHDVTDLHTARANERMSDATLKSFVDNSDACVSAVDRNLRFTLVNDAVCAIAGVPAEEWYGRTVDEVLSDRPRPELAISQVLRTGVPVTEDERWEIPGQGTKHYLAVKFPLRDPDGQILGVGMISADVTDRQRQADLLREAKMAAEQALQAALEANRSKDAFVSRMSHELRTPLNSILGFGQLLAVDELTTEQREEVGQILRAGAHLLRLINEVLDVTRLAEGRQDVAADAVALPDVVREACAMVSPLADQRGVAILGTHGLGPCWVRGDRQRCLQILINLLGNAIKYNREGGLVRLRSSCRNGTVAIEVDDTGTGIAAEHLDLIFEPFNRLGAEHSGVEGTGIGLALSRTLAQQMGGDILVKSVPGEGSTFTLLPEDAPPAPAPAGPGSGAGGSKATGAAPAGEHSGTGPAPDAASGVEETAFEILCIEDNAANLRLMERIFALRPGVVLREATTGGAGLELAARHEPQLVMVDLHLPDLDGAEVVRRLRAETSVPCVAVVSADASSSRVEQLLAGGADLYFTKPIDVEGVLATVDRLRAARST